MEQLIAGAKFPAKCVKNEIHNLLTTLRLTRSKVNHAAQFHHDALRSFQRLFEELTYIHELHEFDTVAYLGPFLEVIQSDETDGQVTAVALGAVDKFVSFGLIHPNSPRCTEAVNNLAWGVINCRFISTNSANDEAVLLKMIGVLIDCLRCPAGDYLSDLCVWNMVRKCFQISRHSRASHLLRSSAEGVLQQMILTIFGTHKRRTVRVHVKVPATISEVPSTTTGTTGSSNTLQVYKPYGFKAMHYVLRFLAFLLDYGRAGPAALDAKQRPVRKPRARSPAGRSPSPRRGDKTADSDASSELGLRGASALDGDELAADTHCLGLSLLNVALESGGDEISRSDELICVIQDDICKSLLQNSRTDSLSVLSLTLRAIFNLFLHFRRHLKVQLEIFFTSVHLKIAGMETASYDQREIALESLLEFCREPELMLELYENYDCDVRCTDLFETLVKFLVTNAFPSDGIRGVTGGFSPLHRLAMSGLVSILHSMSLRCEGHGHFCETGAAAVEDVSSSMSVEPELQRKREQKRRLTLAARAFNSEPFKSMPGLQSLGLVSSPATPESMAEFLRHTPGLDLRHVGEYLSKRHDFNGQVRKAFLDLFPFPGLGLVEALRTLLGTFRLPGEAQLIERLMESFAEAYYVAQPPILDGVAGDVAGGTEGLKAQDPLKMPRWVLREKTAEEVHAADAGTADCGGGPREEPMGDLLRVRMTSSDTIFVLAYSIIMLNTDLHSVKVAKKMTAAEFARNNRGIDNGKNLPDFYLTDIYEAIRDEEIRLHGDAPAEGGDSHTVVDDFFWEGILRRSECIDDFSATERLLSEMPPGASERDMLQVIVDCQPLPTFSKCFEHVADSAVAAQAMGGLQDMVRLSAYFDHTETVNSLARVSCQYFETASSGGRLTAKAQIALRALLPCILQNLLVLREPEWRLVLVMVLRLWSFDLLPSYLTELDDFAGADGRPLESLCKLRPPFPAPIDEPDSRVSVDCAAAVASPQQMPRPMPQDSASDGFFESLARWFEDETRDAEDTAEREFADDRGGTAVPDVSNQVTEYELPVASSSEAIVHHAVRTFVARSGFLELFTPAGMARLPSESWQTLARAAVALSKPASWTGGQGATMSPVSGAVAETLGSQPFGLEYLEHERLWHNVADPIFGLELLTNMTTMPQGAGQHLSQIWPLVSTHFERLIQHAVAGGGATEQEFVERLIVNTLRLCIRLISNADLVPTLLTLTLHLSKLPSKLFAMYSERIACGLLVLVKETTLPHSGLCTIFALLRRISEFPECIGACNAGLECVNHWLSDDSELSRLLSMQQFHELLATLKAFAADGRTPASAAALGHLSSLVPQMARGSRNVSQVQGQWQSLWVPTLHALADVAKEGSQRSSAQAFVYLQRLLLERGTELSLPWEEVDFSVWKECMEQVLLPLLQAPAGGEDDKTLSDAFGARRASAAQLICRVVLTHMPDWLQRSPTGFPVLFLRLLHILVSEAATPGLSHEPLVESLKNLLLVISADPLFSELPSANKGETLLDGAWGVVSPSFPGLRREIVLILDPEAAELASASDQATPPVD